MQIRIKNTLSENERIEYGRYTIAETNTIIAEDNTKDRAILDIKGIRHLSFKNVYLS